jgi:hypothetical protein
MEENFGSVELAEEETKAGETGLSDNAESGSIAESSEMSGGVESDRAESDGAAGENTMSYDEEPGRAAESSGMSGGEMQDGLGYNKPVIIFVVALFLLLIGLCIFIAVSISNLTADRGKKDTVYQTDSEDPWEDILGEDAALQENGQDDYPNHDRSEFTGPYYEDFVDSIDESVSYQVNREIYECAQEDDDIQIYVSYIQLDGDIPAIDTINEYLESQAMVYAQNYEENKEDFRDSFSTSDMKFSADTRSYVTYNDEEKLSIAIMESVWLGSTCLEEGLCGININLATGTILDNDSILSLDDGFGSEFRKRSNQQNGTDVIGIKQLSDSEILSLLRDSDSMIILYTPVGLELGYRYRVGGYCGWVTISMQDYEKYLAGM